MTLTLMAMPYALQVNGGTAKAVNGGTAGGGDPKIFNECAAMTTGLALVILGATLQ
jgi:hypothetical protein